MSSNNGQVVLTGEASDAVSADRAVSLAKACPGGGVVNAMQVAPSQQVMLKVRFLEVARSASRELGVNWFGANAAGTRGVQSARAASPMLRQANASTAGPAAFRCSSRSERWSGRQHHSASRWQILANNGATIDVLITALETKGLVRRLAEPDLVALSGDTAAFLAGGEFPVPIAQPVGRHRRRSRSSSSRSASS